MMNTPSKSNWTLGWATLIFLAGVIWWHFYELGPIQPVPATAPASEFSSGRAMVHLKEIADEPHFTGTPAHAAVRRYITDEIKKLGLEPQIQEAFDTWKLSPKRMWSAWAKNIVVKLPGTGGDQTVMIVSHYDSVPNSHGAMDDGAGVVTMLETLRALKAQGPLKNDVIFLFTDAEEIGLIGAQAFADQHPWADSVKLILNLESSGRTGPVLMFETGSNNRELIRELSAATPYIFANSIFFEVYKHMPNDTDFSVFKGAGKKGFNFANIDQRYTYHTQNDSYENTDEGVIQHMGTCTLSLARHFADMDKLPESDQDAVYFNLTKHLFFHYSNTWVLPLGLVSSLLMAAVIFLAAKENLLSVFGVFKGLLGFIVMIVTIPLIITVIYNTTALFFPDNRWWLLFYSQKPLFLAFVCIGTWFACLMFYWFRGKTNQWIFLFATIMVCLLCLSAGLPWYLPIILSVAAVAIFYTYRKGCSLWDLLLGLISGWFIISIVIILTMKGVSFLFTLPLILFLLPLVYILYRKTNLSAPATWFFICLFSIPALFWTVRVGYLFSIGMGLDFSGAAVAFVVLALCLCSPLLYYLTSHRTYCTWTLGIAGVGILLTTLWISDFEHPYDKPNTLFYGFDGDTDRHFWASTDATVDEWTSIFLTSTPTITKYADIVPGRKAKMLVSEAPSQMLTAPAVKLLKKERKKDTTTFYFQLQSSRQAPSLYIFFKPETMVLSASVNGKELLRDLSVKQRYDDRWWIWRFYDVPDEGLNFEVEIQGHGPLHSHIMDITYALPLMDVVKQNPRPDHMMPHPRSLSNTTVTKKTFKIGED